MKKYIIPVLSGVALLTLAYGARQLYLLYNAKFRVIKTKIKNISSNDISITMYGELENKSDISAVVNGQHYNVFFNKELVSTINAKDVIHINSNGKTIIPISISFNPLAILKTGLSNLANLLLDRTKINIDIKGQLSIKAGIISLKNYKIDMKYTLQELIDISKEPTI